LENEVEIVIGDDTSPDSTREYLEKLEVSYPFIKTFINSKNLGLSGNMEAIVAAASGEYIWHFGEDDLIINRAIQKVLQVINDHNPNYLIINTKNILSLDNRNLDYKIVVEDRLNIQKDVFVKNFEAEANTLFKIENWLYLTGLLSAVACKRQLFLDWMDKAKHYVHKDNVYLYQAPVIMGIAKLGKLYLIAEPLVLHRKNENHWTHSVPGILMVNLYDSREIVNVIREYMPREAARHQKRFAAFILAIILSAKRKGINVNKYILDAFKRNYNCYPYNFRFLAVLLIPGFIVRRFF